MLRKNLWKDVLAVFLLLFSFGQVSAQVQELAEFKDVNVPFGLRSGDLVMKKGTYDFILLRNLPNTFLLKIKKRGKSIGMVSGGEKVNYPEQGNFAALQRNPDIPKFAKMALTRDLEKNVVYLIVETGKQSKACPFHKIRFEFKYLSGS